MPATDADAPALLAAFEDGTCDPARFGHAQHLRVAYELLALHPFDEALARFCRGVRRIGARVGRADRFHMTITVAFLALVAERRAADPGTTWERFGGANADLFDVRCLARWYPPAVLASDVARRTFLLPAPR